MVVVDDSCGGGSSNGLIGRRGREDDEFERLFVGCWLEAVNLENGRR